MLLTTLFAALALGQNPAPVTTVVVTSRNLTTAPQNLGSASKKLISASFNDASLKDVLNFLHKQKIDFAVDPDQFKDRRLSLSLNDVTTSTALSAIASALDAHWETVGGVKILKKGAGMNSDFEMNFPSGGFGGSGFAAPFPKGFDGMKGFSGPVLDKKAMEEMQKAFEEMGKTMGKQGFEFKGFDKAQSEEMKKALEQAQKELQGQQFGTKGLSSGEMDEVRKALEEAQKQMSDQKFEFKGFDKAQNEELKKAMESAKIQMKSLNGQDFMKGKGMFLGGQNFGDLTKSISPAQKELQKKQGYLKISDLTAEQRKMVGISGTGTIEITIVRDGETLKIKSE